VKACRVCGRLFTDEAAFCQADGQELTGVSETPLPGDREDKRVGQLLCGRYQVFRVVADGGMGRVYEGLDQQAGRHVALKILHEEVAGDSVSVERFKREYEVSSSLPHQHIVEVTDFQPLDDSYVLAMEFLVGEELRSVLKRERSVSPERLVRMVSQIAIGLDEAHRRQFIHRDLKPDNIFLCQTRAGDIAKLLDFGSAKDRKRGAKQLTVLGTTIGSPYYMSPEQAQALDTLDQRADVWAMTAVIYECITGSVPFVGNNAPSILLEILRKDPTPPSVAAAGCKYRVPASVDQVIVRGLRKAAVDRIATIGALADELGRAYGLEGEHHAWAAMAEAQLGRAIRLQLPDIDVLPSSPNRDTVAALFEQRPASEVKAITPGDKPSFGQPSLAGFGSQAAEDLAAAVPLRSTSRWVYVAVLCLTLGVVVVWLVT
jgi:serine/threonine protein kinase